MLRMNEKDKSIAVNAQINGAWESEKLLATKDDLENRLAIGSNNNGFYVRLNIDTNHKIQLQTYKDGSKFEISAYENGVWSNPFIVNKS